MLEGTVDGPTLSLGNEDGGSLVSTIGPEDKGAEFGEGIEDGILDVKTVGETLGNASLGFWEG